MKKSFANFSIEEGNFFYKGRIFVPYDGDYRAQIVKESHHCPSVGHPRVQENLCRSKKTILSRQGAFNDVKYYVLKCAKFQFNMHEHLAIVGLLCSFDIPHTKRESMSIISIVGLPRAN